MYTLFNGLNKHLKLSKHFIIRDIWQIIQCVTLVEEYIHASVETGIIFDYA